MKKIIAKLGFCAMLTAAVLCGCGTAGTSGTEENAQEEAYVVKINGQTVSREEFNIYMYETQKSFESLGGNDIWETDFDGRSAESVARDNTLSTVSLIKYAVEKAEEAGIELDDEAAAQAEASAEELYGELTDNEKDMIGADLELYKKVMRENALYNEVYKYMVRAYVVSDEDFEEYYSQNRDTLEEQYRQAAGITNEEEPVGEDEVRDFARYNYEEYMKQLYFSREYEKWEETAEIEKDASQWNTITLIR